MYQTFLIGCFVFLISLHISDVADHMFMCIILCLRLTCVFYGLILPILITSSIYLYLSYAVVYLSSVLVSL